jgi:lysophospholipase L1-like esterase
MENKDINICVFGDSIVWGANDYEKAGWVERLKIYFLENTDDVCVYNFGVSGDNSEDLLKRFSIEAKLRNPNAIIFAIGINDSQYLKTKDNPRMDAENFKSHLLDLVKNAEKFTDKIIFVGLTIVDKSKTMPISWDAIKYYDNENISRYNTAIKLFCEKRKIIFIDLTGLLNNSDLDDGLHPNSKGHQKIFEKIKPFLEKILK